MVLPPVLKVWRFTGWVEERVHEVTDSAVYEIEVSYSRLAVLQTQTDPRILFEF